MTDWPICRQKMFNLEFVFDDAIRALAGHADGLAIAPLPATVYLMQADVINHYRYALDHYLTVPLDAPFLQHSSLGTPYQKWEYFTNEDFGGLSFAVHNLLRYTSRLVHESELRALADARRYEEKARIGNVYTSLICEVGHWRKTVGLSILPNHRLSINALEQERRAEPVICQAISGGPTLYYRRVLDSDGKEQELPIDFEEYRRAVEVIRPEFVDISDRARLADIHARGHLEVAALRERNRTFKQVCDDFYRSRAVAEPFEKLMESY
jgi:hypothetical protein